jgi:hypothetical protein
MPNRPDQMNNANIKYAEEVRTGQNQEPIPDYPEYTSKRGVIALIEKLFFAFHHGATPILKWIVSPIIAFGVGFFLGLAISSGLGVSLLLVQVLGAILGGITFGSITLFSVTLFPQGS